MKSKNEALKATMISIAIILVIGFLSCKKESSSTVHKYDMAEAARLLNGEQLSGRIAVESSENEVVLNYNKNTYFLIQKLSKDELLDVNSMSSAVIVASKYGLVIRDVTKNTVLLLANNDAESKKRFEAIKPLFGNNSPTVPVFGITIVNAEKA
jgi:hypothetical protein